MDTQKPPCRLINPAKSDIQKVSKKILDNINNVVRNCTGLNQWKNTHSVLEWFKNLKNKVMLWFFKFDVRDLYPSITPNLLNNALNFASKFVPVSDHNREIIFQSIETFLFKNDDPLTKNKGVFDCAMGSYDGAETCEVIGLYLLYKLTEGKHSLFKKEAIGIYRDDGLSVVKIRGRPGIVLEALKQKVTQIFKKEGLDITVDHGMKCTDFLDVKLDLEKEEFRPFRKPNDSPVYIDVKSNHPPTIIKQIPKMINKRLSNLSSNEKIFNEEKEFYETALKNSGHPHKLEYSPPAPNKRQKRKRKIIYYNPPFCLNVSTNIGRSFLNLF